MTLVEPIRSFFGSTVCEVTCLYHLFMNLVSNTTIWSNKWDQKRKLHREFRAQLLRGRKADRKCNGCGGIEYAIVSWGCNVGGGEGVNQWYARACAQVLPLPFDRTAPLWCTFPLLCAICFSSWFFLELSYRMFLIKLYFLSENLRYSTIPVLLLNM